MENKKMIETIEKKLDVKVAEVYKVFQTGKEIAVDVNVGGPNCLKVVLKEMRNQYGPYYRIVSESTYTIQEKKASEKKRSAVLRTKTERLCRARRKDIIDFAERKIASLADGSATFKEIEGPAKEDTTIRFVLILKADGSRFKEDITVAEIRDSIAV